jgi:hypothetical protein
VCCWQWQTSQRALHSQRMGGQDSLQWGNRHCRYHERGLAQSKHGWARQLTVGSPALHEMGHDGTMHPSHSNQAQHRGAYISSCSKFHLMRALSCPLPPALGALAFEALLAPLLPVDSRAG